MKKKKIFKTIGNTLLILLIIILVEYFVLRLLGFVCIYRVETGSMEDGIHAGDHILILNKKYYHKGEVITYRVGEYYITHRIVEIDGDKVITKGDANNVEDEAISKKDIVGKVIYNGGFLNILIEYKFIIAGFMVAMYLFSCYFESRKVKPKE